MKFSEEIDFFFDQLHGDICQYHQSQEKFIIQESAAEGHAEVEVVCGSFPCFHVKDIDKKVFPVLKHQRCADHLIFVFKPATKEWCLHIFEMTKSISAACWNEKICPQFEGALMNAYAILGILHSDGFSEVSVHCCYRKRREPELVERRCSLGMPVPKDWLTEPVGFSSCIDLEAQNAPVPLDKETGYGQISL